MNTVIVVGDVSYCREIALPGEPLNDEVLVVGIEANHELLEQFARGSPPQRIKGFDGINGATEFLLGAPSFMNIRTNVKQVVGTPGSKNSEFVYPAYADLLGGTGILLQVAPPKKPRQAWCYSSYHRHADESAPGPRETFWSLTHSNDGVTHCLVGNSQVYMRECNVWKKLNEQPLVINPGCYHQIRATGWSINLLVLTNIQEGGVLELGHDHGIPPLNMSRKVQ